MVWRAALAPAGPACAGSPAAGPTLARVQFAVPHQCRVAVVEPPRERLGPVDGAVLAAGAAKINCQTFKAPFNIILHRNIYNTVHAILKIRHLGLLL